jgi:hypothetical protein
MYWSRCTSFPPKLKERDWKNISTTVDAGNLKHELLNWLWSILAVNMLREISYEWTSTVFENRRRTQGQLRKKEKEKKKVWQSMETC